MDGWIDLVRNSHLETNSDDIFLVLCFCPSKEIREGGRQLLEKLQKYKPLIAAFNGKGKMIETLLFCTISV